MYRLPFLENTVFNFNMSEPLKKHGYLSVTLTTE